MQNACSVEEKMASRVILSTALALGTCALHCFYSDFRDIGNEFLQKTARMMIH
jgi:hypothetical protein